jgi:hypothetical protein
MTEPSATDPDAPDTAPGTCTSCGAQLAPEQDWCLVCGTASPSRIGDLPGLRTAAKVAALTLVLVVGAVGASYAALNHGGKSTQIAALPPAPAPTTTATPTTATTPATTPASTTTSDDTPASPPVDSTPTVPPDDSIDDFPTDTTDTGSTDTGSGDTTDNSSSTPRATTPTKTTTTKAPKPKSTKIRLARNAVSSYDPLVRVQSHTDAAAANDGDPSTLFTINTVASTDGVQSGFLVDLGSAQKVTEMHLQTPTPGFTALIYGAVGPDIPKALTDPAWHHLRNATDVGSADGTAKITLGKDGKGVTKYRYLLLWVTNPPSTPAGARDVIVGSADTSTTPTTTDPASTTTSTVTPPPPTTTPTVATTTPTTTPTAPTLGATVSVAELTLFS